MKLKNVISRVDGMKPNAFSNEVKTGWVNELENMVQTEIFLLAPEEMVEYTWEENAESELLIRAPYSKLYWIYLSAMIDFTHGEYDKYSQTMQMFNAWLQEYQIWYARTFRPADGGAVRMGYYLSAYGLAKLHGFEGTEEDWLKSLVGPQGAPFTYDDFTSEQLEALRGPEGPMGKTGVGIEKVALTEVWFDSEVGGWKKYTITMTDGSAFDFTVNDGKPGAKGETGERGISSVINGVVSWGETTEEGVVYYLDATVNAHPNYFKFVVPFGPEGPQGPPGPSGSGTGDMTAAVYDPQGKAQDIFKYVDDKTKNIDVDVTADEVTFADGQTFQQKYDSGDLTGPAGPAGANGQPGAAGKDATINGVNALTLTTGTGLSGSQSDDTYTLSLEAHKHSAADIQAGTLTGIVGAMSNVAYTTAQVRSIILSTADAGGGSNGQVWIKYK